MEPEQGLQFQIRECLTGMGISSPVDWDVLVFVYRHKASLANFAQIARMLGYPSSAVGESLERLESLKLLRRSRTFGGVSLYQFVSCETDLPPYNHFRKLIALVENRAGRLQMAKKLRQSPKEDQNG